jgi:SAM-dependent methyltransferase
MNRRHRKLCSSEEWAEIAASRIVPAVLGMERAVLGDRVLELGPGFGATTRALAAQLRGLTVLELEPRLARRLRLSLPAHVEVVDGDASAMPFADGHFSAVLAFTMLHHVSPHLRQQRLFAEAHRVLQPGGVFAGTDARRSFRMRLFHRFDTFNPLDPATLADRLHTVGFDEVEIHLDGPGIRFLAVKPSRGGHTMEP